VQPNVVVIILDTLRKDHSSKLSDLESLGFTKYRNAVATSSWTLPSHVSFFTGQMPSKHGIHESQSMNEENLHLLHNVNFQVQKSGILIKLKRKGYCTYGLSCNPYISPTLGFPFDHYGLFGPEGDLTDTGRYYSEKNQFKRLAMMVKDFRIPLAVRTISNQRHVLRLFRRRTFEKGSTYCIRALMSLKLEQPFFLFINLMEAHDPYSWDDIFRWREINYKYSTNKPMNLQWKEIYPLHAKLAILRLFTILQILKTYLKNSVFVITSDHGQLLGEGQRYGHGLFLDDELLQVPLYVKFPTNVRPLKQERPFVSLSEIPLLVESAIYNVRMKLGSDFAIAESFGPAVNLRRLVANNDEEIRKLYDHKIKILSSDGQAIFNSSTQSITNLTGSMEEGIVEKVVSDFFHHTVN
jgi:hypothetical protein